MGTVLSQVFKNIVWLTFAFATTVLISQMAHANERGAFHGPISTPFSASTTAPYPIPYPYPAPYPQPYPYPYPAPYPAPYPPPAHFYQCFARDPYARQYYATGYDLNATQQYAVSVCVQSTGFPCQALGCYWR